MIEIKSLFHIAIKSHDVEATRNFYCKVMEMETAPRPALDFDGVWLRPTAQEDKVLFHIYAGDAAFEPDGSRAFGTGAIDHIAVTAQGYEKFRERFARYGLDWRENVLEEIGLWQLFVYDPSGVMLEMSFSAAAEGGVAPPVAEERQYKPKSPFFDLAQYPDLS